MVVPSTHRTLRRPSRGVRKRSRQESPSAMRSVRARTSSKKRRTRVAPKRTYAGPLIASKPVRMAKPGARIRQRQFGHVTTANRAWIGGKSTGSEFFYCSLIAEALTAMLFKKLGNTTVDKDNTAGSSFLKRVNIGFVRDETIYASTHPLKINIQMLTVANSFNHIVYNTTSPHNVVTEDGVTSAYRGFNEVIYEMAIRGYYPSYMFAWRHSTGYPNEEMEVFRDEALDRANIKLSINGTHKFQNVTPAGANNFSANAIDANPLSGKMYTFRNQMPTYQRTWLGSQTGDSNQLELYVARPYAFADCDYPRIAIESRQVMPTINVFDAPPLRPATIFSNCKKTGKVYFPPGGFKDFKTQFTYDGSLIRLLKGLTQVIAGSASGDRVMGKVPPLGESFLMCVMPTLKSLVAEPVQVGFDFEKDGQAHMTAFKSGTLPTTNFIQGLV